MIPPSERTPVRVEQVQTFEDRVALMRLLDRLFSDGGPGARPRDLGRTVSALSYSAGDIEWGLAVLARVYETPVGCLLWQRVDERVLRPHWGYVSPSFRRTDVGDRLYSASRRIVYGQGRRPGPPASAARGLDSLDNPELWDDDTPAPGVAPRARTTAVASSVWAA